jgi:hypothetical protein
MTEISNARTQENGKRRTTQNATKKHASFHNLLRALLRFEEWSETKDRSNEMCRERPTSLAKLSSPSERVLSTCVDTVC